MELDPTLAIARTAAATRGGTAPQAGPDLTAASEEFEALFISQMLAPMFETLKDDSLFGGGGSERIYRSLMVQEYGKAIAAAGGIGIAESVQREMLQLQENQA